jgi:serine O-acetyltransferase
MSERDDTSTTATLSALLEDYRAHGSRLGAQGFWAVAVYRYGRWAQARSNRLARKGLGLHYRVLHKAVQVVGGIELPREAEVGRHFIIDHAGGIVISGFAKLGDNCRVRPGVVIGLADVDDPCAPELGDNVDVGAGAKVLGRIRVGNNVRIGANAVVVRDVPDDSIAVGVPAVVKPRKRDAG